MLATDIFSIIVEYVDVLTYCNLTVMSREIFQKIRGEDCHDAIEIDRLRKICKQQLNIHLIKYIVVICLDDAYDEYHSEDDLKIMKLLLEQDEYDNHKKICT
jgi:hypothetical protein